MRAARPVEVGPFSLDEPLGQGGMGAVWRGLHRREQVPVAIKVVHSTFAGDPWFLERFRAEVRAMARLDHPNIVTVLDYGEITEREAELDPASGFPVGSPWLAMELIEGRGLLGLTGRLDWGRVEQILQGLLAGLAHAHARGVLHRDIKPGNIVVAADRAVLLDFGLATTHGELTDPEVLGPGVGTAAYMPPEQVRGQAGRYGPWSDLYSLGAVGWALVTGQPPFGRGRSIEALLEAQLHAPLPPLFPLPPSSLPAASPDVARAAVPEGLQAWLGRMLAKDPAHRFQRAADAAGALSHIGPPGAAATGWRRPLPSSPAAGERRRPSMRLVGAGLGLFGLRRLPVVGREAAQRGLWESALDLDRGAGGIVLLQGPAGCGKTSLARWLGERLHELGVADVVEGVHGQRAAAADGLGPALGRWLRVTGLGLEEAREQLRDELGPIEEPLLAEALALTTAEGQRARPFASAVERYAATRRLLLACAARRPIVVRLDDVQWGLDSLAFIRHFVSREAFGRCPVLFLLTARELTPESAADQQLAALLSTPLARRIEVGPLAPGWRQTLIREHLRVEGDLARDIEQRTGGNPLFAVQLVGDWVQRGLLVPGETGFRLRDGASAELPDDLHSLWQQRLGAALEGMERGEREAVEVAATLGMSVDRAEWAVACRAVGAWASPRLMEALLSRGLVQSEGEGQWSFIHAMLRESVLREAEAGQRSARWHQAAADMLRPRLERNPALALRLGRHLRLVGAFEEALEPLSRGAWQCVRDSEYQAAEVALAEREELLDRLGLPPLDRRRVEGAIMGARVARRRGALDRARRLTEEAERDARASGQGDLLVEALRERSRLDWHAGRRRAALGALLEATELAQDPPARAWCLRDQGLLLAELGEDDRARPPLEVAVQAFEDEPFGRATAEVALARLCHRAGLPFEAHLRAAEAGFSQSIRSQEPAHARVGLGDVARLSGDLPTAEAHYRAALDRFRDLGAPGSDAAAFHLVGVLLRQGKGAEANDQSRALLRSLLEEARGGRLLAAYVCEAAVAAVRGQWRTFDRLLVAAQADLRRTELDADSREMLDFAAGIAEQAGDLPRAAAARGLSRAPRPRA